MWRHDRRVGFKPVGGHGRSGRLPRWRWGLDLRRLRLEPLEDRRLLSVASTEVELFSTAPATFIANEGQWADKSVRYAFLGDGANVLHTDTGPVIQLFNQEEAAGPASNDGPMDPMRCDRGLLNEPDPASGPENAVTCSISLAVTFDGAVAVEPMGTDLSETFYNFLLGEQANWRSGVSSYEMVAYPGLYDGIDLLTFGQRNSLKYEFHVAPGADYTQIEISYVGSNGLWIDDQGQLHVATEFGDLVDDAPYVYQVVEGQQVDVAGHFVVLDADTYTFAITGQYDPMVELVIDPNLDWGSYLGGSYPEWAYDVATDGEGNVFVCGCTQSSGWGIAGGSDITLGGSGDGYLVKLSGTGAHLWSTYLGGSSSIDDAYGVATDSWGNVYVCGETYSTDWGISGGWDTTFGGSADGYLVKLSGTGAHLWSTYLGGSNSDGAYGVATDSWGNVYVCGKTRSTDWGISGGWDTSFGGGAKSDGFLVKLSNSGSHLWSTYQGASNTDEANGVTTDSSGNVYVCGSTFSAGWGISGGWDTSYGGNEWGDGYLVKLSGDTGAHLWSTYVGGSDTEWAYGVASDGSGNVFVSGVTDSSGWGVSGGLDTTLGGTRDGFLVKLSGDTGAHLWSTYIGGSDAEGADSVASDSSGNVYVCGGTGSTDWGISGGWDTTFGGSADGYLVKLSGTGAHLWSTYLGGSNTDGAEDVATDGSGHVYVAGTTRSSGWGISGGWDTSYAGYYPYYYDDGYVIRASDAPSHVPVANIGGPYAGLEGGYITLDASGSTDSGNDIISYQWDLDNDGQYDEATGVSVTIHATMSGIHTIVLKVTDSQGSYATDSTTVTVNNVAPTADAGGPYSVAHDATLTLNAAGSIDPGYDIASYAWDLDNDGAYDDATGVTADFSRSTPGTYTVRVKVTDADGAYDTDEATVRVLITAPGDRLVHVAYVIPSNRTPQPDGVEYLQFAMQTLQAWYLEQMQRNGFGTKTFVYETEPDGQTPKIHVVNVAETDAYLRANVADNVCSAAATAGVPLWFDGEVWLLIPEIHRENSDGSISGGGVAVGGSWGSGLDGGMAMIPPNGLAVMGRDELTDDTPYAGQIVPAIGPYPLVQDVSFVAFEGTTFSSLCSTYLGATLHELSHAFGLPHDFRNDDNFDGPVMGNGLRGMRGAILPDRYGTDDTWLSYGQAMALANSPYFNVGRPMAETQKPTVSILTSGTVNPVNGLLKVQFSASDNTQLTAAFITRAGDQVAELALSGKTTTATFDIPYYTAGASAEYSVYVYDTYGNRGTATATITVATGFNTAPQPYIDLSRTFVTVGASVTLDAVRSTDPDHSDSSLLVEWDLNGDGMFDTTPTTQKQTAVSFDASGTRLVRARLTDPAGASAISAPIPVRVVLPPLPGDANGSGTVDAADAQVLAAHWGLSGMTWADGDFNTDGMANASDASILAANWGRSVSENAGESPDVTVLVTPVGAPFIGPIQARPLGVARRLLEPVSRTERKDVALLAASVLELASAETTGAVDVAMMEDYGPQMDNRVIDRQRLAWSYTLARRKVHERPNKIVDPSVLAIDLLLSDPQR